MSKNKKKQKKALEVNLKTIHKINFIIYGALIVLLIILFMMIGNKQVMTTEQLQEYANEHCYNNITIPTDGLRYKLKMHESLDLKQNKPSCELLRVENGR